MLTEEQIAGIEAATKELDAAEDAAGPELSDDDLAEFTKEELAAMVDDQRADDAALAAVVAELEEAAPEKADPDPLDATMKSADVPNVEADRQALKALKEERDALIDKFDDGEIDRDTLRSENQRLDDAISNHAARVNAAEAVATDQMDRWYDFAGRYMEQNPALKDPAHIGGFNEVVIRVTGSEAHSNKPWAEQLNIAHRLYAAEAEIAGTPLDPPKKTAGKEPDKPRQVRTDERPSAPSLADMPASDGPGSEGAFSGVDRLIDGDDPHLAEDAFDRMSDEQRERFLTGA